VIIFVEASMDVPDGVAAHYAPVPRIANLNEHMRHRMM